MSVARRGSPKRPSTSGRRSSAASVCQKSASYRQMHEENARLKRLVADLTLDKQILQEVLQKSAEARPQMGAGSMDSRPLPGELPTRVCARADPSSHLVL